MLSFNHKDWDGPDEWNRKADMVGNFANHKYILDWKSASE